MSFTPEQNDAVNAAHLIIKATLKQLLKRAEENSFHLRPFEHAVREAEAKAPGKLDKMQMNMNLLTMASLVKRERESLDAVIMLIQKLEAGLEENQKLRSQLLAMQARKDGVLVGS